MKRIRSPLLAEQSENDTPENKQGFSEIFEHAGVGIAQMALEGNAVRPR